MVMNTMLSLLIMSVMASDTIRVGVVDTGIDYGNSSFISHLCEPNDLYDAIGDGMQDNLGHGKYINESILSMAKDSNFCFVVAKWTDTRNTTSEASYLNSLHYILGKNVTLVNLSLTAYIYSREEYDLINDHQNVLFIVAAGNEGYNLDSLQGIYPPQYMLPNIVVVGALNEDGEHYTDSNFGAIVRSWEIGWYAYGHGTSFATAIHTGRIIYNLSHLTN